MTTKARSKSPKQPQPWTYWKGKSGYHDFERRHLRIHFPHDGTRRFVDPEGMHGNLELWEAKFALLPEEDRALARRDDAL